MTDFNPPVTFAPAEPLMATLQEASRRELHLRNSDDAALAIAPWSLALAGASGPLAGI